MGTTGRLDDDLVAEAKELAARTGRSLNAVIEDALRDLLARREERARIAVRLTTFRGNGLRPG